MLNKGENSLLLTPLELWFVPQACEKKSVQLAPVD
jgi:hypothetical protein